MKIKSGYLKYIAVTLGIVVLVAAALILLKVWENSQGKYPESVEDSDVLMHEGREYIRKEGIETFLVIGLDKYYGDSTADSHEGGVQADFLVLFVLDNENKECSAIHINRDTMTKVNKLSLGGTSVVDSYTKQIALAYNYVSDSNDKIRCRNTKDSVEYLLKGIKVDHYLSLTMDCVAAGCDLVGGVELEILDDFSGIDDTLVKGETVTLKGEQALTYVRTRYGLEDSTNSTRMARQQQYMNAFYDEVMECMEADDTFALKLVDALDEYVVYDSSDQKMQKLAEKIGEYEFVGFNELEGETEMGEEFIEFYPDEDALWELISEQFYTPKS